MNYEKKPARPPVIKESGWTVDDYFELPEDGHQYELVNGRLELKPSPNTTHQRVLRKMEHTLTESCEDSYIIIYAPVDIIISKHETRQPDILMIHRSRKHIIEERGIMGPPDLVIEILSPNSVKRDRTMKLESYAKFGVPEYWIVTPLMMTIEQYVQTGPGEPYTLAEVFGPDQYVSSERIPCASFKVRDGLTIE